MSILYLLIPLAVVLMAIAIAFFLWTVRTGQYDDLEGPAHRILMDDDDPMIPGNARPKKNAERPTGTPGAATVADDQEKGGERDHATD